MKWHWHVNWIPRIPYVRWTQPQPCLTWIWDKFYVYQAHLTLFLSIDSILISRTNFVLELILFFCRSIAFYFFIFLFLVFLLLPFGVQLPLYLACTYFLTREHSMSPLCLPHQEGREGDGLLWLRRDFRGMRRMGSHGCGATLLAS